MNNNQELVISSGAIQISDESQRFLPVMSLDMAVDRREVIVKAVQRLMKAGEDFGVIPGTKKPTLLQPGADKLNNLFGLVPTFLILEKDLDWKGDRHGGEPFFYYEVKCRLMRGDFCMGEGDGSASSWESKYRYRKSERICPSCGAEAIIKGKAEFGGGWVCFQKKAGCGAKFKDSDPSIAEQVVGNKPNPDIADVVNTILKMANKRAKIAATLNAVSAHEFFTQDVEDMPQESYEDVRSRKISEAEEYNKILPPERQYKSAAQAQAAPKPVTVDNIPPGVVKLWADMGTKISSVCAVFERLKADLVAFSGNEEEYYTILNSHGFEHANDVKRLGIANARKCARELYESVERWRKANEPDVDERFHLTDADLPVVVSDAN